MAFIALPRAGTIQPASGYSLVITGIVCTFCDAFILPWSFAANKIIHKSLTTYTTNHSDYVHHDIQTVL